MPRLFTAIDIPNRFHEEIAAIKSPTLSTARWTKPKQWHITLHFIGDGEIEPLHEALKTIQAKQFQLRIEGIGTFPTKGQPKVLWLGIEASKELNILHNSIGEALKQTGFQPDARRYKPHLTLARFKGSADITALQKCLDTNNDFSTPEFDVSEFVLYQSELQPDGAVYTALHRYPLK